MFVCQKDASTQYNGIHPATETPHVQYDSIPTCVLFKPACISVPKGAELPQPSYLSCNNRGYSVKVSRPKLELTSYLIIGPRDYSGSDCARFRTDGSTTLLDIKNQFTPILNGQSPFLKPFEAMPPSQAKVQADKCADSKNPLQNLHQLEDLLIKVFKGESLEMAHFMISVPELHIISEILVRKNREAFRGR